LLIRAWHGIRVFDKPPTEVTCSTLFTGREPERVRCHHPLPSSGSIDLNALDDYLMSNHAPDDSKGLSDLDGFLTGVVVGPELILPSEWLPVIWGGEEPVFQTEEEVRTVLGDHRPL
jgi:hypothetical protein